MSKIALCIGLNYNGTSAQLNGCINDAHNIRKVLLDEYKYDSVTLLTDETEKKPTYANIINALYTLVIETRNKKVDTVMVTYSGHGSYMRDNSGDEKDGRDELLVPLDYEKKGMISDDILSSVFNYFLPETKVIVLFDCCHSGSLLDLKYNYDAKTDKHYMENSRSNLTNTILMISGCMDNQTSADAYNLENQRKYSGAMTSSFLSSLKNANYNINCLELVRSMSQYLKEKGFEQLPQMSSSKELSEDAVFSALNIESTIWMH
jgi:hypothetical protein